MDMVKKPTLLSIRLQTAITTRQLADAAGVSLTQVYIVEIGGFVERAIAEQVITAFSRLAGTTYTLDVICFQNVPAVVPQHMRLYDLPITKHTPS